MTNFQHLDVAHRMIRRRPEARPAPAIGDGLGGGGLGNNGNGNGSGNGNNPGETPSPTPPPTSTSNPPPPPSSSSTPVKSTPSTSSTPPPPPPTSTSKKTPPPTSTPPPSTTKEAPSTTSTKASSTSSSSIASSSSVSSVASSTSHSTTAVVPTNNAILGNTPTNAGLDASSFANVQPTDVANNAGTTVTADPVDNTGATGISAGSIVGIVVGVLLGLGLVALCIMFLIRRVRRARRYAQRHESDFGTFNRSAFVREKEPSIVPDMSERSHNVAPSLTGEAMSAAIGAATPPSQALAAANAASAGGAASHAPLQERPKYVFGQPVQNEHDAASEDDASELANGVYSSQPVMQTEYNPEAYGSYAKYEDVAGGAGGYQDAQREYQGQQGYQGYYDQQGYSDHQGYAVGGYDEQQQAYVVPEGGYDYSAQHAQYAAGGNGAAAGAYEIQQQQGAYQQPHPYATHSAVGGGHDAAYGGM